MALVVAALLALSPSRALARHRIDRESIQLQPQDRDGLGSPGRAQCSPRFNRCIWKLNVQQSVKDK